MYKKMAYAALIIYLSSCQKFEDFKEKDASNTGQGYIIKSSIQKSQLGNINLLPPQPMFNISDVFVTEDFMFIAEFGKGIHILEDPESPKPTPVYFIAIPALQKFTIKDNHIICNNGNDIIAFRISGLQYLEKFPAKADSILSDVRNFGLVNRQSEIFEFPNYPQVRNIYFECPDTSGFITEWQITPQNKPLNCYR